MGVSVYHSPTQLLEIVLTFLTTGYENCSPVSANMQQLEAENDVANNFRLTAEEKLLVKKSLNRAMRRWKPMVMCKKLARLMLRDLEGPRKMLLAFNDK